MHVLFYLANRKRMSQGIGFRQFCLCLIHIVLDRLCENPIFGAFVSCNLLILLNRVFENLTFHTACRLDRQLRCLVGDDERMVPSLYSDGRGVGRVSYSAYEAGGNSVRCVRD